MGISFPRYKTKIGSVIGRYLRGGFGDVDTISPYLASSLYALDRLTEKPNIESWLKKATGKPRLPRSLEYSIRLEDGYPGNDLIGVPLLHADTDRGPVSVTLEELGAVYRKACRALQKLGFMKTPGLEATINW